MAVLDPVATTLGDICAEALKISGRLGLGQTALAEDTVLAWTYLQWLLQQWDQKRMLIYRLVNLSITSTGAQSYTLGPSGDIDTGTSSVRPSRIASAFARQVNLAAPNQPDWPLEILNAREDYDRIRLKKLSTLSEVLFYDPAWPLGICYPWPVLPATLYALHVTVFVQLPYKFATQADVFDIPYNYYWAMVTNLAMRLRIRYGIQSWPGDTLPNEAKASLNALKETNVKIPLLEMPAELSGVGGGGYNIFSDQSR